MTGSAAMIVPRLLCPILLAILAAFSCQCATAVPASSAESGKDGLETLHQLERRYASEDHTDTRWRMISAMLVMNDYSMAMTDRYATRPELVLINRELPTHVLLQRILDRVCNLVAFHQLALRINDTTDREDFYPLLSEVISDSCKWMHYLANYTDSMILTDAGSSSNLSSCSADEVTLLHQYCYRTNVGHLLGMMDIENFALHSYISAYHRNDVPHVPASDFSRWLNTTSLHPGIKSAIHANTVMAILQYIIGTKI